jgi:phosphoglycolate phosphatase-like HAD superfamily hydrolase
MCINVGHHVKTDLQGYTELISLYHRVMRSNEDDIVFDFKNTYWFEANLVAVLGAIECLAETKGYKIQRKNISDKVGNILMRNGFLKPFPFAHIGDTGTVISFQQFTPEQAGTFNEYISKELLSKPDFPNHSPLLRKRIGESIFEIFENARTHGRCEYIHTCGQYFPNTSSARLDMTIVDMGNTITNSVNSYLTHLNKDALPAHDAIEWAIQTGNTTKTDRSGGLGLGLLMDFIRLNKGGVQFVSGEGYLEFREGKIRKEIIAEGFPGTFVNMEFNFNDDTFYRLQGEPVLLDNIF